MGLGVHCGEGRGGGEGCGGQLEGHFLRLWPGFSSHLSPPPPLMQVVVIPPR